MVVHRCCVVDANKINANEMVSSRMNAPAWMLCLAALMSLLPAPVRGEDKPMDVHADTLEMDRENQGIVAKGNVQLIQGSDMELKADEAGYSGKTREVHAEGNVRLVHQGSRFSGDRVVYNTQTRVGHLDQVTMDAVGEGGRGGAKGIDLLGPDTLRMEDAWYTQCECDPPPWKISANEIDIDRKENSLIARDVKFHVGQVPVAWLPWWEQPVNKQRKSGFLTPDIRTGDSNGFEVEIPYYFNLAPERDMTVAVRPITRRGVMGKMQYRYMGMGYEGKIQTQQIQDDLKDTWRGLSTFDHKGRLWGWDLVARGEHSQTRDYINDYHQNLVESTARRLESHVTAARHDIRDDGYSDLRFGARWNQDLEAVDDQFTVQSLPFAVYSDSQPMNALPDGWIFDHLDGNRWRLQREFHLDHFYQTSGDAVQRFDAAPAVEYARPLGVLRLKVRGQLRETAYMIQGDPSQTGMNLDSTQHRESSTVSAGLGTQLFKSYPGFATHTLEPRIEYVHSASTDQGLLPNYDATQRYFAYSNLFGDSLYSGLDRISIGHRVGYALTSRLLNHGDASALWQNIEWSIGQRWAPEGSREYQQGQDFSQVVSALGIHLRGGWEIDAANRYDPDEQELENTSVRLSVSPSRQDSIALGYHYNQPSPAGGLMENNGALLEDAVIDTHLGLNEQWSWSQEASYSLNQNTIKSWRTGLAYEHQCWKLSLEGGRNLAHDTDNHGGGFIGLFLGLKGIGDYGV
ncbi:MAG: LPS-assembly protein LptD [Magnetococcales bacterium]|nr:LPS-assembly protein LptD [Magnetococcales bacterium]MBF0151807.1 LPS-assembly protein LptD [Magnetococcales bacterium]MBF0172458.1 LPS-assembly protein LptD [Magnetococcales bacterium]MBF0632761.1 LPS-assembly protein LptD [Magnetococcales bacterium]